MKHDKVFTKHPLESFDMESQSLIPGVGKDEYHVLVRPGSEADILRYDESGELHRTKESIGEEEIFTAYDLFPTSDGYIVQQGKGILRIRQGETHDYTIFEKDGETIAPRIPYLSREAGPDKIWVDLDFFKAGEFPTRRRAFAELRRDGSSKKIEVTREIDIPKNAMVWPRRGGLLLDNGEASGSVERFRLFDSRLEIDSTDRMAQGLNALARSGYLDGEMKISGTRPWVLIYREKPPSPKANPEASSRGLFAMSFLVAPAATEIECEGHPLVHAEADLSMSHVALSPHSDLFVVLAPHGQDSLHFYLGVMRRDAAGYRPVAYRVRTFPKVFNPALTFSRDGNSIVFLSAEKDETIVIHHAFLADLLADINRRYPDAKLDLNALKAEVK